MLRCVAVYGFGTAFSDAAAARDVDLLIIHYGIDHASCQLAIQCKSRLASNVTCSHITMLSDHEEAQFHLIKTARAIFLGEIREQNIDVDLALIINLIPKLTEDPSKLGASRDLASPGTL